MLRSHGLLLLRAFLRRPRWSLLDLLIELATPPLSVLGGMVALCVAVSVCFGAWGWARVAVQMAACVAVYVGVALWQAGAPWRVWLSLLAAPVFVAWKLALFGWILVRGGPKRWVRTERNRSDGSGT